MLEMYSNGIPTMDMDTNNVRRLAAEDLALRPTRSCRHMDREECADAMEVMLGDLERLAKNDGCIAAAWALEYVMESLS